MICENLLKDTSKNELSKPVVLKLFKSRPTFQNINFRVPHNSACTSKYLEKVK